MSKINSPPNDAVETSSILRPFSISCGASCHTRCTCARDAGVAYTNVPHQPLVGYWEFLALAIGVVCVVTRWPELDNKQAQFDLASARHFPRRTWPYVPTALLLGTATMAAVPAISWVKQSFLFLLLAAVLLIGLGMTFWLRGDRRPTFLVRGISGQMTAGPSRRPWFTGLGRRSLVEGMVTMSPVPTTGM